MEIAIWLGLLVLFGILEAATVALVSLWFMAGSLAALIAALEQNVIAGAGLDVFEREPISKNSPLLHMPNVIATPHSAWYTEESIKALQRSVGEEVVRVLGGNPPLHPCNIAALKKYGF